MHAEACTQGSHSNKVTLALLFIRILEKKYQINMNTQPTTSSFIVRAAVLLLTVLTTTGAWAQSSTTVSTEDLLNKAITDGANIQLTADIQLSSYLNIEGKTVTIDLNGHKLYRWVAEYNSAGHVIYVHGGSNLTLTSTAEKKGMIQGGMANNGGAINIPHGNTVSATNVNFHSNSALVHGGAIWNSGTFTATNCTFTENSCTDVGAIYNAVQTDNNVTYAGKATLTNCTISGNWGTTGAGALANALGDTEMTIIGGTIEDNTAGCDGGAGIWNGGRLNMKGAITVKDNINVSGLVSNVYLKNGTVITVTGSLAGSHIGVDMESVSGTFTSGYDSNNSGVDPKTIFTADRSIIMDVIHPDGEAELGSWYPNPVTFIERSWDSTNKKVVSTEKLLKALIGYGEVPDEGKDQYKEVTNPPTDEPDQGFRMGGYCTTVPEYYVVRGDVTRQTIVVQGSDVHLILCDGATLTINRGLRLEGTNKLYIHCQSYGGNMGKLKVPRGLTDAAGIGSAWANEDGGAMPAGELVIYGGDLDVKGGAYGAGIGSCRYSKDNTGGQLSNRVTVYGGKVKAEGGKHAAGIGGGAGVRGGDFILYGGTVTAKGGEGTYSTMGLSSFADGNGGAGIGGGYGTRGGNVTVYGGTLTAESGMGAAGIGSANLEYNDDNAQELCGGTFTMYDGTVTAIGHGSGAGIGGGMYSGGADVKIYGGTLTATGNGSGAGIGSGNVSDSNGGSGGRVTITGGTVTATGGNEAAGIGGGNGGIGAVVTISGGTVTANGGKYGAGIGGGGNYKNVSNINGGTVTISGGTVTATGGEKAAGIGGGYKGDGGTVTITGGTVIAKAGIQGGTGNRAIGPGQSNENYGTLTIGNTMMVGAGNSGSVERIYDADERKNACWYRSYAEISPCTHPAGLTYTINNDGTHTSHCKHCTVTETAEHSINDVSGTCICGYKDGGTYFTITIATSSGTGYEGVGESVNVGKDKLYTLPVCSTFPEGYDFAGWVVNPTSQDNGIRPNEGETLLQAGEDITVTANVNIFARYKDIDISLADDSDNSEKLYTYNGKKAARVILTGRTLWKDGDWNTLCLPFSLSAEQIAASDLAGADIRELTSTSFSNGTLTLDFTDAGVVTDITAGKPYIVKWTNTTPNYIENPEFTDVTIVGTNTNVETEFADFVGVFSPTDIYTEEKIHLYLGSDGYLYYPWDDGMTSFKVNSCRAFFRLNGDLVAGDPISGINNFVLNFGGEETNSIENGILNIENGAGAWYTLDGRRLSNKPSTKGVYIHVGRKMVIK